MSYLESEIKFFKSVQESDLATNGGVSSFKDEYVPSVRNNAFPHPTQNQLNNGVTFLRKVHIKLAKSTSDVGLVNFAFLQDITPAGSSSYIFEATKRDTQGDITGSEDKYGACRLKVDSNAGSKTIIADAETGNGANNIIKAGYKIWLFDTTLNAEQELTVDAVTWATDEATITTVEVINANFLAANDAVVTSAILKTNVTTGQDGFAMSSVAGSYDNATYPLVLNHLGTVEETWNVTMTSATDFSVISDIRGAMPAGNINTDYSPINPDSATPYGVLLAAGFSGSFVAGESFVVNLHPATIEVWWAYVLTANLPAFTNDDFSLSAKVAG